MADEIWDIKDRLPVELPDEDGDPIAIMKMPPLSQAIAIDRYERAVRMMPRGARSRYLRFNATADVLVAIYRHGIKHGLTTSQCKVAGEG